MHTAAYLSKGRCEIIRTFTYAQWIGKDMPRLREFGPSLWIAEGPTISFFGFAYPTRMAAIRLADGGLFVWSPIALTPDLKREVETLGQPSCLVAPNKLHHLFLGEWKSAYPNARLYAPPGLRKKRRDLRFDADLGDAPAPQWAGDLDQVIVRGSPLSEVVFFHRASRTAIFADLLQNFPPHWFKGWRGVVARLDGIVAPSPGAPREWRASFYDRRAARSALDRILSWPVERVLIAHGAPASGDGKDFIRRGFAWLLGHDAPNGVRNVVR
jgi:hypothetical protein